MKRHDDHSVSLTPAEMVTRDLFVERQGQGWTTPEAAVIALRRMDLADRTDDFIEWLSEDTCRRWGQRVIIRPEWRRRIEEERKINEAHMAEQRAKRDAEREVQW